jgi:hypothetical protein
MPETRVTTLMREVISRQAHGTSRRTLASLAHHQGEFMPKLINFSLRVEPEKSIGLRNLLC